MRQRLTAHEDFVYLIAGRNLTDYDRMLKMGAIEFWDLYDRIKRFEPQQASE